LVLLSANSLRVPSAAVENEKAALVPQSKEGIASPVHRKNAESNKQKREFHE
jgi:hypothetical protein